MKLQMANGNSLIYTDQPKPTSYSIRLAVKTPSTSVQYRMLEADVTVTGSDLESLRSQASEALVLSLLDVCTTMGEVPPSEIAEDLKSIYGSEVVDEIYGVDASNNRYGQYVK